VGFLNLKSLKHKVAKIKELNLIKRGLPLLDSFEPLPVDPSKESDSFVGEPWSINPSKKSDPSVPAEVSLQEKIICY